jgi:hypothetical protein
VTTNNDKAFIRLKQDGDIRIFDCNISNPGATPANNPFIYIHSSSGHIQIQNTTISGVRMSSTSIIKLDHGGSVNVNGLKLDTITVDVGYETSSPILIGAFSADHVVSIEIRNSVIGDISQKGVATVYGGIIGVNASIGSTSTISLDNLMVTNIATTNTTGGFLFANNVETVKIEGTNQITSFADLKSATYGGVLYLLAVNNTLISNTNFNSIEADNHGGAIYFGMSTAFDLSDVTFVNCLARGFGGAICTSSLVSHDMRRLTNVHFSDNNAIFVGADICDISSAGEVYDVNNVINCTSFFSYGGSSTIYPWCKFYILEREFILDCLLPHPNIPGTACGYGSVLVNPTQGKDHRVCGDSLQPCLHLSYAIGVAGDGGNVVLVTGQDFPINNTNISNKSFTITEFSQSGVPAQIISVFDRIGQPLFAIKDASLEVVGIVFLYVYPTIDIFAGTFFRIEDDNAELILTDCALSTPSNVPVSKTFIESLKGKVILDGVRITFTSVLLNPLFRYVVSNEYSSFTIKNSNISGLTLQRSLLEVSNGSSAVNGGSLYVLNSKFINIIQTGNDKLEGLIISVDFRGVTVGADTGYLTVIDFEDNVFYNIKGNNVTNGGSICLNVKPPIDTVYNYYIYNNSFVESDALERGGAIYIFDAAITFSFCSFIDCNIQDPSNGYSVHSDSSIPFDINLNFIRCCAFHSQPLPLYELFFSGITSSDSFFTVGCIEPREKNFISIDGVASGCSSSPNRCHDLGAAISSNMLKGTLAVITNYNIGHQNLNINDLATRIMGESDLQVRRNLIYTPGSGTFITVTTGTLSVENLVLIHENFVYFLITGGIGTIRVTDCEVTRSSLGSTSEQGSFIVTENEAINSAVYIKNTYFHNLLYGSSSLIKIGNCHVLSLVNVDISNGVGLYQTGVNTFPFLIDASHTTNIESFSLELDGVQIEDINITHDSATSKGLISVVSDVPFTNIIVKSSHFDKIRAISGVAEGGLFHLKNINSTVFENTTFSSSGGASVGGAVYVSEPTDVWFVNTIFDSINVENNSRGGAVYVEVGDVDGESGKARFDSGLFRNCTASSGSGGAIYLKFLQDDCGIDEAAEHRVNAYYFNLTEFVNNAASNGTNVFIEAYDVEHLFTDSNFKVDLVPSGTGLIEYVGLDNCEVPPRLVSIPFKLLQTRLGDAPYIFVTLDNYSCPGDIDASICGDLKTALTGPSIPASLNIEIIDSAELQEAIKIYGNAFVIEPAIPGSYVILVIGLNGTLYLESGTIPMYGEGRLSNAEEGANITFTMMNIKLAYRLGAFSNPFTVVKDGIVTFTDCAFSSGSENIGYPDLVSVYIAVVGGAGKLVMKSCTVSNIKVEGNFLLHAYENSMINIEVTSF